MPIKDEIRLPALEYINAHLFDEISIRNGFSFITDVALMELILLELKSARYVFRLMEMLDLKDHFSHPFCKFQIVQYAGIIEAAVDHLLFDRPYQSAKLSSLLENARIRLETHSTLTRVAGLSSKTDIKFDGNSAFLAVMRNSPKPRVNISFENRLQECLNASFVDKKLLNELLGFYKQRNSVHLSAKLKNVVTIELGDAKRAFRRVNAFCENVKRGFRKYGEPVMNS